MRSPVIAAALRPARSARSPRSPAVARSAPAAVIRSRRHHPRHERQVVPFSEGEASRDAWRTKAGCGTTSMPIAPSPCVAYDACDSGLAFGSARTTKPQAVATAGRPSRRRRRGSCSRTRRDDARLIAFGRRCHEPTTTNLGTTTASIALRIARTFVHETRSAGVSAREILARPTRATRTCHRGGCCRQNLSSRLAGTRWMTPKQQLVESRRCRSAVQIAGDTRPLDGSEIGSLYCRACDWACGR